MESFTEDISFYRTPQALYDSTQPTIVRPCARLLWQDVKTMNNPSGFAGLRVLSLESRRAEEIGKLIRNFGGNPTVAPSMREVRLTDNHEAVQMASELLAGRVQAIILLTGVGTRLLLRVLDGAGQLVPFLAALKSVPIVARGPKPIAALAEVGLRPTIAVPEPNTWRELLQMLDEKSNLVPIRDRT
ncbi:MAG: uroporphyrinogen-III synthase, partial [Candidatus Korobacteraceae bacterium]